MPGRLIELLITEPSRAKLRLIPRAIASSPPLNHDATTADCAGEGRTVSEQGGSFSSDAVLCPASHELR